MEIMLYYYEVAVADSRYKGDKPLTYHSDGQLAANQVVSIPLRGRLTSGFIIKRTTKPSFPTQPVKALVSQSQLPPHYLKLALWLKDYYACSLSDALKQFAPTRPAARARPASAESSPAGPAVQLDLSSPLTSDQKQAMKTIAGSQTTSVLLHGETGSGKTRVYLELAKKVIAAGSSVIILTPEISLTSQLTQAAGKELACPVWLFHSQLTAAQRRKTWLALLEADEPVVVIGPRSALFAPVQQLGLIVVDEAHEPAYKQEQAPYYQAARVASQLGALSGAKVVLGTATPLVADYYLAKTRGAIVRMTRQAVDFSLHAVGSTVIDLRQRQNFNHDPYLSDQLIDAIRTTLTAKRQVMLYLNRRGSARLVLCTNCGWTALCPRCDIPLTYHGDNHNLLCHSCGYQSPPPVACPKCQNPEIIYRSLGTKALLANAARLFPEYRLARFDSDNLVGQRLNELYEQVRAGQIDIIVGTQLLAKGVDLPKLGLVGILAAETSLALPDFTAEERSFQLLYQVIGRVGRGHGRGQVVIQAYNPDSIIIKSALKRDYARLYRHVLAERRQYRFPPFSYLLKLTCRRASVAGAQSAATKLKAKLAAAKLPVEIIGPAPSFYAKRGGSHYWQLVVRSKDRQHLLALASKVPAGWSIDLDPSDLL